MNRAVSPAVNYFYLHLHLPTQFPLELLDAAVDVIVMNYYSPMNWMNWLCYVFLNVTAAVIMEHYCCLNVGYSP